MVNNIIVNGIIIQKILIQTFFLPRITRIYTNNFFDRKGHNEKK